MSRNFRMMVLAFAFLAIALAAVVFGIVVNGAG